MKYYSQTHLGLVRENNEDALLTAPPQLFAVADGVGGGEAGEVASKLVLNYFQEGFFNFMREANSPAFSLRRAVSYANERLYMLAHSKPEYAGMATTLTVVYLEHGALAHVVQVGDSRLYLWRSAQLRQVTRDQTYVGELVSQGKLTEEQGQQHPRKHWLLQAVGMENVVQAEIQRLELLQGDKLLLCSDGLSNMLSQEELLQGMGKSSLRECGDWLLQQALANGGKDNISLIVLDGLGGGDK